MKTLISLLPVMVLSFGLLLAQDPEYDPLAETYIIQNGGGDELVTMSSENISIYKYYKALERYNHDTLIHLLSWSDASFPLLWQGSSYDIELADLDQDDLKEIIAVFNTGNKVEIALLKADPARMNVDSIHAWEKTVRLSKSSPAVYDPDDYWILPGVFVQAGNLDADSLGEFVVAYWADDGMIEITVYDVDDSLNITEMGTIRDQEITEPPQVNLCEDNLVLFDLQCADFNGDGIDEILLSGRISLALEGYQVFANLYAFSESGDTLEAMVKDTIFIQSNPSFDIGNFNSASGNFHSPDEEDAVIGLFQYSPVAAISDTISNILIPLEMDSQLTTITAGEPIYQRQDTVPFDCYYRRTSTLLPVDLNSDGIDELLSAFSLSERLPVCKIYRGDPALNFSVYADLDHVADKFFGGMVVGNFYKDTTPGYNPVELIISTEETYNKHYSEVYSLHTLPDGSFDSLELKYSHAYEYGFLPVTGKTEALLAGNLDTDIRIGKPKYYSVTEILQPLVILNAPPIHFDVFDSLAYDVSRSFNEYQSEFVSKYIKETQQSTELRTEVNRDWSLSKTISSGFSYWGLSVSAHLTEEYGEKFEGVEGSSRTVTVGFEIEASVDDQIYATVMDYDLWEYPVYGNEKLKGHVLVVDPQVVKNSWFDSKSWKGYSYIPNHEVGNILSYRRYPLLSDNPLLVEKIKGDYGLETSFLMSGNSSYDWFLNFTDFTENQASTTKEYTREWGVSMSFWGSGFSMDGSYHSEDIQTQRTTVESGINLNVHMDAVDMSIGETRYEITPYAYWASNGALVIDYAVSPETAGPGGEDTWWDEHYGYFPDPAFILPWRYDPEKGYAISETKRNQTNDILFRPEDPADGDTIVIHAQVHNFSLLPTPGPIGVRFYVGDPDNGGTLIVGVGDVSEVFTDGIIPARGRMEVVLKWKIPEGTYAFPRIYAEIDADDNLMEIHENNNKSWNILQKTTGPTIPDAIEDMIRPEFKLGQNYPNPFTDHTMIRLSIPGTKHVTIEVFSPIGRKIATLADEIMIAGSHEVEFTGHNLDPGIYYCRITAGTNRQVMKMVLIK
jgi:hypothetical protein